MENRFAKKSALPIALSRPGMILLLALLAFAQPAMAQKSAHGNTATPLAVADGVDYDCNSEAQGSPYIPVDSWIYPAVMRLYSLGYVDTPFLNMRPWTRASVSNMLQDAGDMLADEDKSPQEDEA